MSRNKYTKEEKLDFVKMYQESEDGVRKTARKWNEKHGYDITPSSGTWKRWRDKYEDEISSNGGDESMGKDKSKVKSKSDGLNKLKTLADQSQVDQTKTVTDDKEYQPGEGNDGPKTEKSGRSSESGSGGLALDFSKVSGFFKDHKKQIGLVLAGVVVVGVLIYVKPTIDVRDLQGHGSSNSGNSAGDNTGNGGGGSDEYDLDGDGDAWTGE